MLNIGNGSPYWLWTSGVTNGRGRGGCKQPTVEETIMVFNGASGYQVHEPAMQFAPEMMDVSQHSYDFHEYEDFNPDVYLASYSEPRLKWTLELHDHFVNAVNELGGPYKATPRAILNLMSVPGLTLYHLKSHLQKYRLGKIAKRLYKMDHVDIGCINNTKLPSSSSKSRASSLANPFDMNGSPDEYRVGMLGTQHKLIEENISAEFIDVEGISTTTPDSLPLFSIGETGIYSQSYKFPEWFEVLDQKTTILRHVEDSSTEPSLNTYGYSSEFSSINGHVSGATMRPRNFFDDVENFLHVDANALAVDDGCRTIDAGNFPDGVTKFLLGL